MATDPRLDEWSSRRRSRNLSSAPTAPFGYIGYGLIFGYPVRGASFNMKAKQNVYSGDPASNEPDQPVYHLGPLEVEGEVSFPIVEGDPVFSNIIEMTLKKVKTETKKTLNAGEIVTFLPPANGVSSLSRVFGGCMANRLSVKGTAGERIDASLGVLGLTMKEEKGGSKTTSSGNEIIWSAPFDMARVITWDTVSIEASIGDVSNFSGCEVKEFNFEINNNVSRANTYCWPETILGTDITATALITGRRQISGSLTFIGPAYGTENIASNNIITAGSLDELKIRLGSIETRFNGVVYELQQIDLTAGIIYGRVNFTAHGEGPGKPSVEFSVEAATRSALRQLDREMSGNTFNRFG